MIRTNKDKTVQCSVAGIIKHPRTSGKFTVGRDGKADLLPGTGGITYNVKLGDSVYGLAGDHIEPAVSCFNGTDDAGHSFSALSCIGNRARVVSGDAKGAVGYVFGQHGGVQHIMIDFHPEVLEQLCLDDRIQIKSWGQGLELTDYPDVLVHNIDPELFEALDIEEKDGDLYVRVAGVIPSCMIGSGWGDIDLVRGRDCDLMASDWNAILENKLENLRFGDLVLIQDMDSSYGRQYIRGGASVGVVIHSDSPQSGHGPGITTFMTTAADGRIKPVIDESSNIKKYLEKTFGPLLPLEKK